MIEAGAASSMHLSSFRGRWVESEVRGDVVTKLVLKDREERNPSGILGKVLGEDRPN